MKNKKIIIKASDYNYPSKEELKEVYKKTPDILNFDYISESPILSLIKNSKSISEVNRNDNLKYWNNILLNRNGAMVHSYNTAAVNFARGIPDEVKLFQRQHYINRMQFDYYAEIFYYHFSTVKDTLGQLLNTYFSLGIPINKIYFKEVFFEKIPDQKIKEIIKIFFENTSLASQYRNSFTHRTPITTPDARSSISVEDNRLTYSSANNFFIKTSDIMENMENTIKAIANLINQLKPHLKQ